MTLPNPGIQSNVICHDSWAMHLTASEIFTSVREELLGEALSSPGLLADLANLERYVAETYSARSFIELLQNADDAEATRFEVKRHGEWLICANNGREFSRQDFYSLCRSASSAKQRGQTIGYRGIGFKSVVGVASCVHLFSGELKATFSREITQTCLGIHTPTPLVRIPHTLSLDQNETVLETIQQLEKSGYTTIFVLGGLDVDRVQDEFDQFDADYLLFLRHIREAVLTGEKARSYRCERNRLDKNNCEITISGPDRRSAWHINNFSKCDLAFSLSDGKPVPLNSASAITHAFLPTLESTGFGVRINADFSTDPSRTRIIFDEATLTCINDAAEAIAEKISKIVLSPDANDSMLACLTPSVDLATLTLQKKSFRTELILLVKKKLDHLKNEITLAPGWISASDVLNMENTLEQRILAPSINNNDLHNNFMRYIGIKTLSNQDAIKAVEKNSISPKGCTDLITQCMRNVTGGVTIRQLIGKRLWIGSNSPTPTSLIELIAAKNRIDKNAIETFNASGITSNELVRIFKSAGLTSKEILSVLPEAEVDFCGNNVTIPSDEGPVSENTETSSLNIFDPLLPYPALQTGKSDNFIITSRSLPAWRGAEQYVALMLSEHGYTVEDRSRQNLGYDLYVEKEGRKYYIEVKLIDYAGQPFIITTNEETVARECGNTYFMALTLRDSNDGVHVQFINDPSRALKFVRQCRQWVWECSEYEFKTNIPRIKNDTI